MSVTVAEILCIVGTLLGVGLIGGTRVEESAGGALSAEATRLAPAGPAFSIWSVIYLGLAAYTVWQWLPSSVTERTRSTGWLAAVSMLLNAGWLLVTQQGWIWASVVVILALALVLGELLRRITRRPSGVGRAGRRRRDLRALPRLGRRGDVRQRHRRPRRLRRTAERCGQRHPGRRGPPRGGGAGRRLRPDAGRPLGGGGRDGLGSGVDRGRAKQRQPAVARRGAVRRGGGPRGAGGRALGAPEVRAARQAPAR